MAPRSRGFPAAEPMAAARAARCRLPSSGLEPGRIPASALGLVRGSRPPSSERRTQPGRTAHLAFPRRRRQRLPGSHHDPAAPGGQRDGARQGGARVPGLPHQAGLRNRLPALDSAGALEAPLERDPGPRPPLGVRLEQSHRGLEGPGAVHGADGQHGPGRKPQGAPGAGSRRMISPSGADPGPFCAQGSAIGPGLDFQEIALGIRRVHEGDHALAGNRERFHPALG